jgi:folate-binding protein YgfZ
MLSNDVAGLAAGEACEALLLTAKARVIATIVAVRLDEEAFLLVTEPELAAPLTRELLRFRLAANAEIAAEEHTSLLVFGQAFEPPATAAAFPNSDYGVAAIEVLDVEPPAGLPWLDERALEELRIRARTPRFGYEIDERVLPAEAGLVERAVSFEKGCYPGQEPLARLHYRGHVNRTLRLLAVDGRTLPPRDASVAYKGKEVGRVTSSVSTDEGILALAFVRAEVPPGVRLAISSAWARALD